MRRNKNSRLEGRREREVVRIQNYLETKGIFASETSIINAAFRIVQRNGPGLYAFYCELSDEEEERKGRGKNRWSRKEEKNSK
jgi:hypothetical protein